MVLLTHRLYFFLGVHSFLIGLFPFYIPVYLYTSGFPLVKICFFIAATGAGFCISLYLWDRISKKVSLRYLIIISFLSEFFLLTLFFLEKDMIFIIIAGFFNGAFNCNFWIIQRILFLETITPHNSGRKFGNFQLFVMVVLKLGIFIGGVLLEKTDYLTLYLFSAGIVLAVVLYFLYKKMGVELNSKVVTASPLSPRSVVEFKDRFNSRSVFAVDGVFLFLESYFWVISLFLIVRQSYLNLGLLVIFLTVLFGLVFVVIKNNIDRLPSNKMYAIAIVLYCISWILRGVLSGKIENIPLFLMLIVITFCTSIFRLAFNKRFFDIAKSTTAFQYIFIKSYFSQFFLAVFFTLLSFFMYNPVDVVQQLSYVYLLAAPISLVYFLYRRPNFGNGK
jgi:MFS family permease